MKNHGERDPFIVYSEHFRWDGTFPLFSGVEIMNHPYMRFRIRIVGILGYVGSLAAIRPVANEQ